MSDKDLKEKCIDMYINGKKTLSEIAKITGYSRTHITSLIDDDERFIRARCTRKLKVNKRKSNNQMIIYIPTEFIHKLGISRNKDISEYVNVTINEKDKSINIKKA